MDDAMLSLALRDAFPTAIFCSSGRPPTSPRLDSHRTIPECGSVSVLILVPEPDWRPEFERDTEYPEWFNVLNSPCRYIHYSRTGWFWGGWQPAQWSFDLPTPEFGTFSTNYNPDDAGQRAFVNKVWNILSKLATNRMKSGIAKDMVVLSGDAGGGMIWAGHHILKWCASEPRRMVDGWALPCDDWKFPDTPWHRDLFERATAMFGPKYGGAPAAPPSENAE